MKVNVRISIFLSFIFVFITGCTVVDTSELDDWMRANPVDIRGKVDPLPEVEPYVPFIYQASNHTDPFSPRKLDVGRGTTRPGEGRPKQALEAFDLDTLVMTGVLMQDGQFFALIKTQKGDIYRVGVGNYLGKNDGKITKITEGEIELSETVADVNGEWIQRAATLYLSESDR